MKVKSYISTVVVIVAIGGLLILSLWHSLHPIPADKRAFVPEYTCVSNTTVGDICERTKP